MCPSTVSLRPSPSAFAGASRRSKNLRQVSKETIHNRVVPMFHVTPQAPPPERGVEGNGVLGAADLKERYCIMFRKATPTGPTVGSTRATICPAHSSVTEREFGACREWLGLRELSNYADICERTLRSWIYSPVDPLPAVKVSGKVLVRRSDFDAYLHRHRIKPLQDINVDAIVQDVLKGAGNGR